MLPLLRQRRPLAALAASLAALAAPEPAAAAVHPQLWLFDSGQSAVDSAAEAVAVARRHDLVVGAQRYRAWLGVMRAAHPGILIAPYGKGTAVIGSEEAFVRAEHPDWLLRNADGEVVRNEWGASVIDPSDPEVRAWRADAARRRQAEGWNAVYLDALGTYALEGAMGPPLDPATGRPFTRAAWIAATAGLAAAVDDAITVPLLANGLRNGRAYAEYARPLAGAIQGGVFEACFRDARASLRWWPSQTLWRQQVAAIADVNERGVMPLCLVKTWAPGTDAARTRWHRFALTSFLLAAGGRSLYAWSASRTESPLAEYASRPLGMPLSARMRSGDGWYRPFTGGAAVVNPTGSRIRVLLGGTYRLPSGRTGSSIRLDAHTGVLLRRP